MINQQLSDFISQQRASGISDDAIRQKLLTGGWTSLDISEALSNNQPQNSVPTPSNRKVVVVIASLVILVLCGGGYYVMRPQMSSELAVSESVDEPQATSDGGQDNTVGSSVPTSFKELLQCSNVDISMPEKWAKLEKLNNGKMDADGCVKDEFGCLCARKDPNQAGKNAVFSVNVTVYPTGLALEDLVKSTQGIISNKSYLKILGYPAIRFTATKSSKINTTAFMRDGKLYVFNFGASENTFDDIWPDFSKSIESIKIY